MMRGWLVGLLLLSGVLPLQAQVRLESGGYLKAIGLRSHSLITDEPYQLFLLRFRLQEQVRVQDWLEGMLWLDNELQGGSYLDTPDYRLAREFGPRPWLKLDWTSIKGKQFRTEHRVNRGYVHVLYRALDLYVGRQRIAWGTGFVWNPTDLMNPTDPLSIEREEKATVDAFYLTVATGVLSRVELAVAPQRGGKGGRWGVRATTNWRTYDLSLMGGYFARDWVVGGDWAGYLGNAGLRGEWTVTRTPQGQRYLRMVLNMDYQFTDKLYGFVEGYFNGRRTTGLPTSRSLIYGTKRFYGAGFVTYQMYPLVSVSLYTLANVEDGSFMIGPLVRYALLQDWELSGGAYFFEGDPDTELGRFRPFYFGVLQFYF